MCLSTVEKVYRRPIKKESVGSKKFNISNDGRLRFQFRTLDGKANRSLHNRIVPRGRWLTASSGKIRTYRKRYPAGFHIYETRVNTNEVLVRYRNVVARGVQSGRNVIIAKQILIPRKNQSLKMEKGDAVQS